MGGGISPDMLMMGGNMPITPGNPRFFERQGLAMPTADMSPNNKDQSRLTNLDEIAQLPQRSPFSMAGAGGGASPTYVDPNQPRGVRTETYTPQTAPSMFAETMSKPRTETVQGVPLDGGVMTRNPDEKPSLFNPPVPDRREASPVPQATTATSPWQATVTDAPSGLPGKPAAPTAPPTLFGLKIPGMENVQQTLKATTTNPLWQTGMGIAQAGFDGGNPYANVLKNISGIQPHELARLSGDIAARKDQNEQGDAEIRALLAKMMMSSGVGGSAPAAARPGVVQSQGAARLVR